MPVCGLPESLVGLTSGQLRETDLLEKLIIFLVAKRFDALCVPRMFIIATGSYAKPDKSNPRPHSQFFKKYFISLLSLF
jgi:hypothetical protein